MSNEEGPFLFVNFPDQVAYRRPPYPRGNWGVPLAPASMALHQFPRLINDIEVTSRSVAVPSIDTEARSEGEHRIAIRGVIVPADELYRLAANYPSVFLSRYSRDGRFILERAGSLVPGAAEACGLAWYFDSVCLHKVELSRETDQWRVTLTWYTRDSLPPHLTIFVHLGLPGQAPRAQEDGDTWRGMLPLTMWQAGDLVIDERWLPALPDQTDLLLRVGLYDRLTGDRKEAIAADGGSLVGDAFALPLPEN